MCRVVVVLPRLVGDCVSPPGNTSLIMTMESPIRIRPWISFPSGVGSRSSSLAPKAFLYQSNAFAAPSIDKYGVTVPKPFGIGSSLGFFGLAFLARLDFDGII